MHITNSFVPTFCARTNIKCPASALKEQELKHLIKKGSDIGSGRDSIELSIARNPYGLEVSEYACFNVAGNSLEVKSSYITADEGFNFFEFFNRKLNNLKNVYNSTADSLYAE